MKLRGALPMDLQEICVARRARLRASGYTVKSLPGPIRFAAIALVAAGLLAGGAHAADRATAPGVDAFPRPAALEPDVRFWERIYSSVTTQGGLIHDDRHLDVVYEQIDFPPVIDPAARIAAIEATRAKYQRILRQLADGDRSDLGAEEQRVLALWPAGVDAQTLRDAASHVRFQLGQADRFREGLQRAGAWERHIREVLRAEGVPEELAALPHVESSFNALARSKAGAAGMWQFMPSTGQRFLHVDGIVDERLDPYKSAVAAARFLSHAYDLLGSWPLALTAYNHGAAGMARAKAGLGTDDIATIVRTWQSPTFGFASRNFYVSFLAALEIDRDPARFFGNVDRLPPDNSRVVRVPEFVPVKAIARASGVDADALRRVNLGLLDPVWKGDRFVPRGYEFRLPAGAAAPEQVLAKLEPGDLYAAQRRDPYYRVGRRETLAQIARREGTTAQELMALNRLASPAAVKRGMVIRLPEPKPIGSVRDEHAAVSAPVPAMLAAR